MIRVDRPIGIKISLEEIDMGPDIKCGACGKALMSFETVTVAGEGDRCYACFNRETADRLGLDFDSVLGDHEAGAWELFQHLYAKMQREMATRHVHRTEFGWQLTDEQRLVGRIEWDPDTGGAVPLLIIDGKALTWEEVGRMLMTFEGFTPNAHIGGHDRSR